METEEREETCLFMQLPRPENAAGADTQPTEKIGARSLTEESRSSSPVIVSDATSVIAVFGIFGAAVTALRQAGNSGQSWRTLRSAERD